MSLRNYDTVDHRTLYRYYSRVGYVFQKNVWAYLSDIVKTVL